MIDATPSVFDASLSGTGAGIDAFIDRHAPDSMHTYYGSGKVALRDGLAGLVEPGDNVVVPAFLSPAVVEPFHELGLESRYYAIEESLAPDIADLEARIDADTAAVVSVNYFGFPQPGLERIAALTDEYDCYHVDDNAHAPLSVRDGTLLGTHGDLGITTLRKLLPVPDGAVLYCTDETVTAQFAPSSLAGRSNRIAIADCRFVAARSPNGSFGPARRCTARSRHSSRTGRRTRRPWTRTADTRPPKSRCRSCPRSSPTPSTRTRSGPLVGRTSVRGGESSPIVRA